MLNVCYLHTLTKHCTFYIEFTLDGKTAKCVVFYTTKTIFNWYYLYGVARIIETRENRIKNDTMCKYRQLKQMI